MEPAIAPTTTNPPTIMNTKTLGQIAISAFREHVTGDTKEVYNVRDSWNAAAQAVADHVEKPLKEENERLLSLTSDLLRQRDEGIMRIASLQFQLDALPEFVGLLPGDVIREGDEFYTGDDDNGNPVWTKVDGTIGFKWKDGMAPNRRRLRPAAKEEKPAPITSEIGALATTRQQLKEATQLSEAAEALASELEDKTQSIQAAANLIDEWRGRARRENEKSLKLEESLNAALRELSALREQYRWIPRSEREPTDADCLKLPNGNEWIEWLHPESGPWIGHIYKDYFLGERATHWKTPPPLPTPDPLEESRRNFEQWYVENVFDLQRDPIGSKLCGDMWKAWQAARKGGAK